MKKFLFTIAVFGIGLINVNGQNDKGDFTLAPQLGLNLSNYSSPENLNNTIRVAFNAGIAGEYYFSDRWSIRSGLFYDSKGSKITSDYTEKLNYLSIPLHANWHFGSTRRWFLNFGPTVGFLLSADGESNTLGNADIKDLLDSTFDFGLGLGIGYKFPIAENTELFLQYQGYNGYININQGDINLFNATSAFNVGVIFKP